jgi:hypothetical protein
VDRLVSVEISCGIYTDEMMNGQGNADREYMYICRLDKKVNGGVSGQSKISCGMYVDRMSNGQGCADEEHSMSMYLTLMHRLDTHRLC